MTLSIVTLVIMQSVVMLSVIYAVSLILSVTYSECHLF
jgi:hypothetical protein